MRAALDPDVRLDVVSPPPTRPLHLVGRELACLLAVPLQRALSATTVERCTAGSLKTSSSSRLALENSVTTAPSGPARNQCSVSGGIVC